MLVRATQPPHIAFVLPGLQAGGSEHIVSLLCNHFAAQGWAVTLLAFEDPATPSYYHHDENVRIVRLGLPSQKRNAVAALLAMLRRHRRLAAAFRSIRPDLIVSFLTRTNVLSVLAARPLGIPVIVSERNNPILQTVSAGWSRLRAWTYPRAVGLVTMTQGAMDYFVDEMNVRGWVIPNPAPPPIHAAPGKSDGRTIGAVGRLVPQKGFDLLIDAFAQIAPSCPDWRLVIWGEGPERAALEQKCAQLGLGGRISLPGVTRQPGEWVAQSDMFVLSSRFEGWGIVVGEAMAAGLPVVAFDCQWGPAEMIEDGRSGVLVPSGDVPALARAIASLCQDEERRHSFSQEATARMALFAPDRVLAQWQAIISGVLEDQRVKAVP